MLASISERTFKVGDIILLVLPEVIAECYTPQAKALRISISDPGYRVALPEHGNIIETLYLEFHDKTRPKNGKVLFSDEQARSIYKFIGDHKGYTEVIIHCGAGMSRSPAIAWALAEFFGSTTAAVFYNTNYIPNQYIYNQMKKIIISPTS